MDVLAQGGVDFVDGQCLDLRFKIGVELHGPAEEQVLGQRRGEHVVIGPTDLVLLEVTVVARFSSSAVTPSRRVLATSSSTPVTTLVTLAGL